MNGTTPTAKYSLYLLGPVARLNAVPYPILATETKFSSASRPADDPYVRRAYWVTAIASIPEGIHSFGGWRFAVRDSGVGWVREDKE
jgi:hypothetical protein